ncbi:MAG TPA: hypothetical protein DCG57_00285 [Candidatus Riflebacteria bacterium]|nr:hypothetical protein [Candidatus Riflebacteria bacterium]
MAVLLSVSGSSLRACDELIHLWQPIKEATDVPFLANLSGALLWRRIALFMPTEASDVMIALNKSEFEDLGFDMLNEVADNTSIARSNSAEAQSRDRFPRLEVVVSSASSRMQMLADMVCYFGITVRASMYSEYNLRYCLLGKNEDLLSIDEIPLKIGLEIDWVYTGNYLAGGMGVHRVALFDGAEVKDFTLWTKADLDKIADSSK